MVSMEYEWDRAGWSVVAGALGIITGGGDCVLVREGLVDSFRRRDELATDDDGPSILGASVDEGRLGRRGDGERVSRGGPGGDTVVG
jgi:hypothetical protein